MLSQWQHSGGKLRELGVDKVSDSELLVILISSRIKGKSDHNGFLNWAMWKDSFLIQIYCDTSVVGGCFDPEFREWSEALWQEFIIGKKMAVFSDLTILELEQVPEQVRKKLEEIPEAPGR